MLFHLCIYLLKNAEVLLAAFVGEVKDSDIQSSCKCQENKQLIQEGKSKNIHRASMPLSSKSLQNSVSVPKEEEVKWEFAPYCTQRLNSFQIQMPRQPGFLGFDAIMNDLFFLLS